MGQEILASAKAANLTDREHQLRQDLRKQAVQHGATEPREKAKAFAKAKRGKAIKKRGGVLKPRPIIVRHSQLRSRCC